MALSLTHCGRMIRRNRLAQTLPLNEPHRITRLSLIRLHQPIHRHHARMLQPRRHFRFEPEPRPRIGIIRMPRLDALDRDRPIQLGIPSAIDLAKTALRMRLQFDIAAGDVGRSGLERQGSRTRLFGPRVLGTGAPFRRRCFGMRLMARVASGFEHDRGTWGRLD